LPFWTNNKGVIEEVASNRDVSNICVRAKNIRAERRMGMAVKTLGCYKKLDVKVVRVWIAAEKGRMNWTMNWTWQSSRGR
jgi:hypothetical protein